MKALERMERLAPVYLSGALRIELLEPLNLPQQLLTLSEADCGYGEPPVLCGVAREITGGLRIGILGANGQGKSTLVKTLAGVLPLRAGHRREGKGLVIGYFAQQEVDVLRLDESPLQHMQRLARDIAPSTTEQEWRNWLGRYQFDGDMMTRACGSFSGGEKARLALALVIWRKPNLLLLDEPTNHLDLPTREALAMALQDFAGTVLLVSHDRALLRATCDAFWLVADGQVRDFDGSLDDYQQWALSRTAQRQSAAQDKPKPPGAAAEEPLPAADRKEAAASRPSSGSSARNSSSRSRPSSLGSNKSCASSKPSAPLSRPRWRTRARQPPNGWSRVGGITPCPSASAHWKSAGLNWANNWSLCNRFESPQTCRVRARPPRGHEKTWDAPTFLMRAAAKFDPC
jgi:ATPase components of ABC transporters with duplicated ATPase domains